MVEDVAGAAGGDHDDRHDRDEGAAIAADLVAHPEAAFVAKVRATAAIAAGGTSTVARGGTSTVARAGAPPTHSGASPARGEQVGALLAVVLRARARLHLALLVPGAHPALPSAGPCDSGPLKLGSACV